MGEVTVVSAVASHVGQIVMFKEAIKTPRADLERQFLTVLYGADPVRRVSTPDIRQVIEACVEASLEALGLVGESEGDPDLTGMLEFCRRCFKPWAEENVERGIRRALRRSLFASLSPDQIDRLEARLRVLVSEKLSTSTFI
jgi:hypothetical protein